MSCPHHRGRPGHAPATPLTRPLTQHFHRTRRNLRADARIELDFTSPLELLVAAILAAQSTDRKTNEVTRVLFARYGTAADYAAADRAELEAVIHPTGYFRAKANTLISLGQALCDRFDGEVPGTWHGRRVCLARTPACGACGIARLCPSSGLGPLDEGTARKLVKIGPFS